MPTDSGITVNLIHARDARQFPEFSFPDTSRSPGMDTMCAAGILSSPKADRILGRKAVISKYIPSIAGARFSIKYSIEPPSEGQLYYFKLSMNGHDMCSWGIDPSLITRGVISRAFFEPFDWNITTGKETFNLEGIEVRPFLFSSKRGTATGDEGGFIDIRVFRAQKKKRVAPILDKTRPRDAYGLNVPTGVLLTNPQNPKFFDWILTDAFDDPFVTFRFCYRSWKHLRAHELIPEDQPMKLLRPSNSNFLLEGLLRKPLRVDEKSKVDHKNDNETDEPFDRDQEDDEELSQLIRSSASTPSYSVSRSKLRRVPGNIFDQVSRSTSSKEVSPSVPHYRPSPLPTDHPLNDHGEENRDTRPRRTENRHKDPEKRHTPLQDDSKPLKVPTSFFSMSRATLDEWTANRPLPELPPRSSSLHNRQRSQASLPHSIAPSLRSWADQSCNDSDIELSTAVAVSLNQNFSGDYADVVTSVDNSSIEVEDEKPWERSKDDIQYATEPPTDSFNLTERPPQPIFTPAVGRRGETNATSVPNFSKSFCLSNRSITPPAKTIFPPPNVTSSKDDLNDSATRFAHGGRPQVSSNHLENRLYLEDPFRTANMTPTEAEWMSPKMQRDGSSATRAARLRRDGMGDLKCTVAKHEKPQKILSLPTKENTSKYGGSPLRRMFRHGSVRDESDSLNNWI